MSDPTPLRPLIEAAKPLLGVPALGAIATNVLEQLEAEGRVRVIPTARAARQTMDRGLRRDALAAGRRDQSSSWTLYCRIKACCTEAGTAS